METVANVVSRLTTLLSYFQVHTKLMFYDRDEVYSFLVEAII